MQRDAVARIVSVLLIAVAVCSGQQGSRPARAEERAAPPPPKDWATPEEALLKNVRQVTFVGERSGESYFSPDMSMVSYQSVRGTCPHYQIFVERLDGTALWRVSPGVGLTTCSFWRPDGKRLIWASTHLDPATYGPPPAEGGAYAWNRHPSFDIFESDPDGTNVKRLTDTAGYDAEGSYSFDGKRIVFASERDGDVDIYTMASDGSDVRRVTTTKGYDGGPFYSPDAKQICYRGFRNPKNPRFANLYVIDADGKNEKQLTFDDTVNWAPYWHPKGDLLVYSKGVGGHRNFELYLVKPTGGPSFRLTRSPAADVLPVFSPDGKKLIWTSTRADGRSQLFIADFVLPTEEEWKKGCAEEEDRQAKEREAASQGGGVEHGAPAKPTGAPGSGGGGDAQSDAGGDGKALATAVLAHAKYLADDALEGRRAGTEGAAKAADYVEKAFRGLNLAPAGEKGTFRQPFNLLVDTQPGKVNELTVGTRDRAFVAPSFGPLAFSGAKDAESATANGALAFRGYGVSMAGAYDDYAGLADVAGKIVVLFLRGLPDEAIQQKSNPHANPQAFQSTYAKAMFAKGRGAAGVLFVADSKQRSGALEPLVGDISGSHIGIPVAQITRDALKVLLEPYKKTLEDLEKPSSEAKGSGFDLDVTAQMTTSVREIRGTTDNVLGLLKGATKPDEIVVVSAHYDHLGYGGQGSLSDAAGPQIHNGADDNASGTAGLIEIARRLAANPPARSILFVGWSGEEEGLLGSEHWMAAPTVDLARVVANVNLDMIGRLGADGVALDGVGSGEGFSQLVDEANAATGLKLSKTAGSMSGRSDHAAFIQKGIPALHLFTGAHADYHKPSDDWDRLNADGMATVSRYATTLTRMIADREGKIAYVKPKTPEKTMSGGGYGASLGTIPSYGEDSGGVRLSGVRAGGPAEKAGMKGGDVLIRLGAFPIDNIQDFTAALAQCRPGQEVEVVVKRDGQDVKLKVTLGRM